MTTFDEAAHPRAATGQFAHKAHREAAVSLEAATPALDPMTWLPRTQEYGTGWTVLSEEWDDDGEATTVHRPDPVTAAALRELLGAPAQAPVRLEHHTVAPGDFTGHYDGIEITAGAQELIIEADYDQDARRMLMTCLAYRQTPPVAAQAAALTGTAPGGNVVVLRAAPLLNRPPSWDRATVVVLGTEDGHLLVTPEPTTHRAHLDRVPERIPLGQVGVLDRAAAVERNPSLGWSKGQWSTAARDAMNEADFLRLQDLARAQPEEDWTYRFEVLPGDKAHGVEAEETKEDLYGHATEYASYDVTTLDLGAPRDRWIVAQQISSRVGVAAGIARAVSHFDHRPGQAELEELAATMAEDDRRYADHHHRMNPGARAVLGRPTAQQYAGYLRAAVDGFLA